MATINDNREDKELTKLLRKLETTEKVVSGLLLLPRVPSAVENTVEKKLGQLEELIANIPSEKIQLAEEWNDIVVNLWAKFVASDRASVATSSSSAMPQKLSSHNEALPIPVNSSITPAYNTCIVPSKSISLFGSSLSSPSNTRAPRSVELPPRNHLNQLDQFFNGQQNNFVAQDGKRKHFRPNIANDRGGNILNSNSRSCYNCGLSGHLARECNTMPQLKEKFDPTAASSQTENEQTLERLLLELDTLEQVVIKSLNIFPSAVATLNNNISIIVGLISRIPPFYSSEIERWNAKVSHLMERIATSGRSAITPSTSYQTGQSSSHQPLTTEETLSHHRPASSLLSDFSIVYLLDKLKKELEEHECVINKILQQNVNISIELLSKKLSAMRKAIGCIPECEDKECDQLAEEWSEKLEIFQQKYEHLSMTKLEEESSRDIAKLPVQSLTTKICSEHDITNRDSHSRSLKASTNQLFSETLSLKNSNTITSNLNLTQLSTITNSNSLLCHVGNSFESSNISQPKELNINTKKEQESTALNQLLQKLATLENNVLTILSTPKGPFVEAEKKLCHMIESIRQIPIDCLKLAGEWTHKFNVLLEQFSAATGGSTVAGSEFTMFASNLCRLTPTNIHSSHHSEKTSSDVLTVVSTVLPSRHSPESDVSDFPKRLQEELSALETDCNLIFSKWSYSEEVILQSKLSQLVDLIDHIPRACCELAQQWNDKLEGLFERYSDPIALFDSQPKLTPKAANVSEVEGEKLDTDGKPERNEVEITDETQQLIHKMTAIEFVTCKMIFRNTLKGLDDKLNRLEGLMERIPKNCPILLDNWQYKYSILFEEYNLSKMAEACMADYPEVPEELDYMDNKTKMEIRQKKIEIADRTRVSMAKTRELFALKRAAEVMLSVRPLPIEKLDVRFLELLDSISAIPPHCVGACNFWNSHVEILLEMYGKLRENPNADVSSLRTVSNALSAQVSKPETLKDDSADLQAIEKKKMSPSELEELVDELEALKLSIVNLFGMKSPPMDRLHQVLSQLDKATIRIPSEYPELVSEWSASLVCFRQSFFGMSEELNKKNKKNLSPKSMEDLTQELNTLATVICKLFVIKPLPIGPLERNLTAMSEVVEQIPEEEADAVTRWNDKYCSLVTKLSLERAGVPEMTRQQIESRLALVFAKVQSVINDGDIVALKRLVQFVAKARRISQELTSHAEQITLQDVVFGWIKCKLPETMLDAFSNQYEPGRKKYLQSLIVYLCQRVISHYAQPNGIVQQQQQSEDAKSPCCSSVWIRKNFCSYCKASGHTIVTCELRKHVLCFNCFEYGHGQKFCQNETASVEQLLQI